MQTSEAVFFHGTKRKILLLTVVALHFSVIAIGVIKPHVDPDHWFWNALGWYGKTTGASASYSFFSPNIPMEMLFHFKIHKHDHTVIETTIQDTANNEVNARVGNILRMIPRNYKDRNVVRSMAASLTGAMFKLFPDAETIDLKSSIFVLPSMDEYRAGQRPKTVDIYSASFARSPGT